MEKFSMYKHLHVFYLSVARYLILLLSIVSGTVSIAEDLSPDQEATLRSRLQKTNMGFVENRGQLTDMAGAPVPFVLFRTETPQMDIYVTASGLTYLFKEMKEEKEEREEEKEKGHRGPEGEQEKIHLKSYRMDALLKGAVIDKKRVEYLERNGSWHYNYFYGHCPDGIYDVKEYKKLRIRDVYPGINWVLQITEKGIKYDFEVSPGADPGLIHIFYSGARGIEKEAGGAIEIKTPMGSIWEEKPVSYQDGKEVSTEFVLGKNHEVSFRLLGYNPARPLLIDPQLTWATLYGGNVSDGFMSIACDRQGNIFVTGYAYASNFPLQNAGTFFQGTNAGGYDVFILKFDNSGNRLWATYYGGIDDDMGNSITTDVSGNLFVVGNTTSTNFPLQNAGTFFQGTYAGGANYMYGDVFILKFDNSGNRLWASYYGGNDEDRGISITTDVSGNLFVTGSARSTNFPLQNAGTFFQGTYAGGGVYNDDYGDVFILKFDNSGNRLWATYYGGIDDDMGNSITTDVSGNLFVVGNTTSTNFPLQNAGTFFQGTYAGGGDAFILKFDNSGNPLWATYYGGSVEDGMLLYETGHIVTDPCGNVYVSFDTQSSNLLTLDPGNGSYFDGTFDSTFGGGGIFNSDQFITRFSNTGVLQWATYWGGDDFDFRGPLAVSPVDNSLILAGEWNSYTSTATLPLFDPGGGAYYDNTPNGLDDSFLAIFKNPPLTLDTASTASGCACDGSATVSVSGGAPPYHYSWQGSSGQDTAAVYTALCPGSYTVTVTDANCNKDTAVVVVQGGGVGGLQLTTSKTDPSCGASNGSAGVKVTGGAALYNYIWSSLAQSSATATGLSAGNYTVTVTDQNSCTISVVVNLFTMTTCTLSVPNVFSPTADGVNDYFVVVGLEHYPGSHISIYNRWGRLVYESGDYKNDWDGRHFKTHNLLSEGVYYYILEPTGENSLKGFITLIRTNNH